MGEHQIRIDYASGTDPVYVGMADHGVTSSQSSWLIKKITYDGSDITLIQVANNVAWDSRTTALYG